MYSYYVLLKHTHRQLTDNVCDGPRGDSMPSASTAVNRICKTEQKMVRIERNNVQFSNLVFIASNSDKRKYEFILVLHACQELQIP
jgi:hypothetical protein